MFELDTGKASVADRWKRVVLISSALVILAAAGLFVFGARAPRPVLTPAPPPSLEAAFREGTPEFDAYRKFVTIEEQTAVESENLLGQVTVVVRGTLRNRGSRILLGVELLALVSDLENRVIAERIALPVPKMRKSLAPGESMVVHVNIDPVPREGVRSNGVILLRGLKLD